MKLNENFLIHQTDNGEILIPVGEETKGDRAWRIYGTGFLGRTQRDDLRSG